MSTQTDEIITSLTQIPFIEGGRDENGCDCWGLVVVFYDKIFNKQLPFYGNVYYKNKENYNKTCSDINDIVDNEGLLKETTNPKFGDIVILNVFGRPLHIGIIIDNTRIIHTGRNTGVVIEKLTGAKWKSRIMGYYTLITN